MNETDNPFPGEAIVINYFTKTPKNWSYLDFLKSNRSEILVLPPFTTDWTGLNGAWQGRFSSKAKENPQWDISKEKASVFLSLTNDAESLANGTEPLGRVSTRPNEGREWWLCQPPFLYHPLCENCGLFFDGLYQQPSAESDDVILSSAVIVIYFAFELVGN
ncbi:hypothetical protein BC937DRAFT_87234 [Endogone sp. FLAS-F59071]|nr:hypothetical protein BC937DRAFT_87234 [Endogone sp. FLAS-F59071]|eukprot:RUS12694.1 hypothetical protein BC937DRAFT_87234 [Endogone sp. FLAS-F59071]